MRAFWVRYRWAVLGVVAVGVIVAYVLTRAGGYDAVEIRGELGPTPGPDASGYIAEKTAFLERVAAQDPSHEAAGLVSLAKLLPPTDLAALVGGRIDLVFTSFPGEDPGALAVTGTVDVTVGARAAELATARDSEVAALEEQAAASEGEERQRRLRAAAQKQAEATALRGTCPCVYAFAVSGVTLADLAVLLEHADVRFVDVADPVVADLRGWELRPLLPPDPS